MHARRYLQLTVLLRVFGILAPQADHNCSARFLHDYILAACLEKQFGLRPPISGHAVLDNTAVTMLRGSAARDRKSANAAAAVDVCK
jgi:hypothetical protein